mgnify:CR=1 FL=1
MATSFLYFFNRRYDRFEKKYNIGLHNVFEPGK